MDETWAMGLVTQSAPFMKRDDDEAMYKEALDKLGRQLE
jgi:hypothetical protein